MIAHTPVEPADGRGGVVTAARRPTIANYYDRPCTYINSRRASARVCIINATNRYCLGLIIRCGQSISRDVFFFLRRVDSPFSS